MNEQLYITKYQEGDSHSAEILISKYINLITAIAKNHTKKYPRTDFEDNLQNAKFAALLALKRYKPSAAKLSTFLYSSIFHYLLSCNDEEAFIKCPTNLRGTRNYIFGSKNNQNFEQKDLDQLRAKFKALSADFIQLSDQDSILNSKIEEIDFLSCANFSIFARDLSETQLRIVNQIIEGQSLNKIKKQLNFTKKQFQCEINIIRNKFVQYYHEC
jgi:DNA-directed RNA polymerase specialized sigma subunit